MRKIQKPILHHLILSLNLKKINIRYEILMISNQNSTKTTLVKSLLEILSIYLKAHRNIMPLLKNISNKINKIKKSKPNLLSIQ